MPERPPDTASAQDLRVLPAAGLRAVGGAAEGDALAPSDLLVPDDIYARDPAQDLQLLRLATCAVPPYAVAPGSALGRPGAAVTLDACLTFMDEDGETAEGLTLIETAAPHAAGAPGSPVAAPTDGAFGVAMPQGAGMSLRHAHGAAAPREAGALPAGATALYLMPLGRIRPRVEYRLVGIDPAAALPRFAQAACMSFTAGTLITMADGSQRPVESLRPGDRVLTRDDGAQPIRWTGRQTLRATGAFAPVLIRAGVLNNARDLRVSPDHRLFFYQRRDALGAGRAEVMVRARHLVNGTTIARAEGGFVDYHQMLFDAHQIIYAEGIAAESMQVTDRTEAALPPAIARELAALRPRHRQSDAAGLEAAAGLVLDPATAERLRRASIG